MIHISVNLSSILDNFSSINYISWYNNSGYDSSSATLPKSWLTYSVPASGNLGTNNETTLTAMDGVYVSVENDVRWIRNITTDTVARNITVGVPGWNLIGFSNNSLTLFESIKWGQTLYNNTATVGAEANVSIRYGSLYNPGETNKYRTYRYTYNNTPWTDIQDEILYVGSGMWISTNVTNTAGDANQNLNNTQWWVA